MESYDYAIIGAGSGGLASARRARAHGARVVIVEGDVLGGTCVNRGCIPKKILWNAAELSERLVDLAEYGLMEAPEASLDYERLRNRSRDHVSKLNGIYAQRLQEEGIELVAGRAELIEAHTVLVGQSKLWAEHVLLATGAHPFVPRIPGAELGITSDDWFELERLPKRLLVIGGGYVGVEISGIARALGSEVTCAFRAEAPLSRFDGTLRQALAAHLSDSGVRLVADFAAAQIEQTPLGLTVWDYLGKNVGNFDAVLWATGRAANVEGLGLERLGVRLDALGFIGTNEYQDTNVAGLHAVGDVAGGPQLTPLAIAQGRRLADRLFGGEPLARVDFREIPTVVFSHPPIGTVGLSEEAALVEFGSRVKVYQSRFVNLYHAVTSRKPRTMVKLVVVDPEERVVGIHVIGQGADELIQGFAVAMRMGARKSDLDGTLAIHPTAAEELVTLR